MVGPLDMRALKTPSAESETWSPETDEDREGIREQLGRVLASSAFRKSKVCSNLLAYIVSRTLEGDAEHLKERTVGVEVFGRAPDYDTATDHVVRSTAGEVRKRLAQYYMEPGRSREIRIEVPPGSYVPRFVRFPSSPVAEARKAVDIAPVSLREPSALVPSRAPRMHRRLLAISIKVAAAAVLSILAVTIGVARFSASTLDRFWQPVLESPNPILLCIGDWNQVIESARRGPGAPAGSEQALPIGAFGGSDKVYLNDAITLARIAGWLQQNGKRYRILAHSKVAFSDLQTGPAILIGLRSNYWTTTFANRLRFTVEWGTAPHTLVMRDRKNPSRNDWSVDLSTPYNQTSKDYALVVRARDPQSDQTIITAAGITHFGTLAAGEFLTNPAQIRKLDAIAPKGWERRNMAIVLATEVIKGSPGSPKIIATDLW